MVKKSLEEKKAEVKIYKTTAVLFVALSIIGVCTGVMGLMIIPILIALFIVGICQNLNEEIHKEENDLHSEEER